MVFRSYSLLTFLSVSSSTGKLTPSLAAVASAVCGSGSALSEEERESQRQLGVLRGGALAEQVERVDVVADVGAQRHPVGQEQLGANAEVPGLHALCVERGVADAADRVHRRRLRPV